MNLAERLALAVVASISLFPACTAPRTPSAASAEADGGELTCDERARAQSLCQTVYRRRCETQLNDCEAICQRNDLPGGSQAGGGKTPAMRNDMGPTQCHENCRQIRDVCVNSAPARCPVPCD